MNIKKALISSITCLSLILLVGCGTTPGTTTPIPTDTTNNTDTTVVANSDLDTLATCMTDAGLTMYGTERCSHCKDQKALFGSSFEKVTFVDCDASKPACVAAGIQGFPTWKDATGNAYPGTQSLEKLASIAGCEM